MDAALPLADRDGISDVDLAYKTSTSTRIEDEEEEKPGDDDADPGVPYNPYSCIFLQRIIAGEAPRLRVGGPILTPPAYKFWFDMTLDRLKDQYSQVRIIDRDTTMQMRTTNK